MKWLFTDLLMVVAILGALAGVRGFWAFAAGCGAVASIVMRAGLLSLALLLSLSMIGDANAQVTWNPSDKGTSAVLSNGNLTFTHASSGTWTSARATVSRSSGKWYFEVTAGAGTDPYRMVGLAGTSQGLNTYAGFSSDAWAAQNSGDTVHGNANSSGKPSWTAGDVIGVAWDADAGNLWFIKNGTPFSGSPSGGTSPSYTGVTGTLFPIVSVRQNLPLTGNFGATAFAYSVPSGFGAWDGSSVPEEVEPVDLSVVFAMQAFTVGAFALVGGVLALLFIFGVTAFKR